MKEYLIEVPYQSEGKALISVVAESKNEAIRKAKQSQYTIETIKQKYSVNTDTLDIRSLI